MPFRPQAGGLFLTLTRLLQPNLLLFPTTSHPKAEANITLLPQNHKDKSQEPLVQSHYQGST